jgi:hypothetical protein
MAHARGRAGLWIAATACALVLLGALAALALGLRGRKAYAYGDSGVEFGRGAVTLARCTHPLAAGRGSWSIGRQASVALLPANPWWVSSETASVAAGPKVMNLRTYSAPLWMVSAPAGLGLALSARRLARGRAREEHCPACGYDLVGLAHGPCPECAAPAA